MPCDSTITTKLKHAGNLALAMRGLGYGVDVETECDVSGTLNGRRVAFSRYDAESAFEVGSITKAVTEISRKYAEIGVRAWAKRRSMAVVENTGSRMKLINRRG